MPYAGTFFGPADRKWHTFLGRGIFFVAAFGSHFLAANGIVNDFLIFFGFLRIPLGRISRAGLKGNVKLITRNERRLRI